MVGQVFLLIALAVISTGVPVAMSDEGGDSSIFGSIGDSGVDLKGTTASSGRAQHGGANENGKGSSSATGSTAPVFTPPPPLGLCPDDIPTFCAQGTTTPTTPGAPAAPTPGTPAVTLADIASFRPTPAAPASEPNGWGIAGLDTNFVADARTQLVAGTLLGRPASVRFTPVAYTWTYGDGSTRTTTSPGTTWQRSGAREFDPTPSSHVFAHPGDYAAQLTIGYSAAYSWDGAAFVPIDGTVSVPAGSIPVHIVVESTVLVGSGCSPGSTAPGC